MSQFDLLLEAPTERNVAGTVWGFGIAGFADSMLSLLGFLEGLVDTSTAWLDVVVTQDEQLARTKSANEEESEHQVLTHRCNRKKIPDLTQRVKAPARPLLEQPGRKIQLSGGVRLDHHAIARP
jgi:hypothetical protein